MSEPKIAIILPDMGAAPVVLSSWFADPGDAVFEGDRLVEVLVGGATFDVSSVVGRGESAFGLRALGALTANVGSAHESIKAVYCLVPGE